MWIGQLTTVLKNEWPHTWTSSSLRIGIVRTVYFCLSSFDSGADINRLLMWDGAVKCLFRFFLRDADTCLFNFIPTTRAIQYGLHYQPGTRHVNKIFIINIIQPQHTFLALLHKWNSSIVRNKEWPYTQQMHRYFPTNFTFFVYTHLNTNTRRCGKRQRTHGMAVMHYGAIPYCSETPNAGKHTKSRSALLLDL